MNVPAHPFSDVDHQSDPQRWVQCLDDLAQEPLYKRYKAIVLETLHATAGATYLELGCGTGNDAQAVRSSGAHVVCLDRALTMTREARRRGLPAVACGEAEALPFDSSAFDGAWADRTFQHLRDPDAALAELVRVLKPGGRIVLADPDYSTQSMNFPDREIASSVLQFRALHGQRNGTLAHTMDEHLARVGLEHIEVRKQRVDVRDPTALDNVLGLRSWASAALRQGLMSREQVARWERLYDEIASTSRFRWSVTFFITAGNKHI